MLLIIIIYINYSAIASDFYKFYSLIGHAHIKPDIYKNPIKILQKLNNFYYITCAKIKFIHHISAKLNEPRIIKLFELIYSDLSGKFSI